MRRKIIAIASVAMVSATAIGGYVWAAVGVNSSALRGAVTLAGVRAHQSALQAIADDPLNGGTRVAGSSGHDDSAAYVKAKLEAAGYTATLQPFDFPFFSENSPAELELKLPLPGKVYINGTDFLTMEYSGSGDAVPDALLQDAGGIQIPPGPTPSSSSSGCTAADFAGFVAGRIALVQRGTCTFAQKAANAEAALASAVIIFNEGQPGRTEVLNGTLGGPASTIPVLGVSFDVGAELFALTLPTVHVKTDTTSEIKGTNNVIAETAGGRGDRVVVVGAHLDSVLEGPGIQDNGTGSAAILEIALKMKALGIVPRNKVRFMWYSAEELGLLGSEFYVSQLTARQRKNIALMLNFDMIGSPNAANFIYDGDGSATPQAGPNGSSVVEDVFTKFFNSQGMPHEPTAFDGRSDYGPFIAVGIPAGGLFTGAEGIMSTEQEALYGPIYGSVAGTAYDHCYHQACDDFDNINLAALDFMVDATADAVLQFAMTTSAVRGTSKANDQAVKLVPGAALAYRGGHLQK